MAPALLIVVPGSTVVAVPAKPGCVEPFSSDHVIGALAGDAEAVTGVVPQAGTCTARTPDERDIDCGHGDAAG
jgi:hypothetical protein